MEIIDIINNCKNSKVENKRNFISFLIGYDSFITKRKFTVAAKSNWSKYIGIYNTGNKNYYVAVDKFTKILIFENVEDGNNENYSYKYTIEKLFEKLNADDNLIKVIYYATSLNKLTKEDFDNIPLLNTTSFKPMNKSRFILGAGVSIPYGSLTWEKMIDQIVNKKHNENQDKNKEEFYNNLSKYLFNNNYAKPQILKDIDEDEYYAFIYRSIYSDREKANKGMNDEKQTLYAVASVLIKQAANVEKAPIEVLTFNYDDYLSRILNLHLNCDFPVIDTHYSIVKDKKEDKEKNKNISLNINKYKIEIKHVHGFLPQDKSYFENNKFRNDIILTNSDYLNTYRDNSKYTPKTISTFIKESCILVGNSLTDYEEQKIFKKEFKNNQDIFHYIFLCKEDKKAYERKYMQLFFIRMGCIPIWFDSFEEEAEFISTKE